MEKGTLIITLVLFTLLAGLAVGFYQLYSVEESKKKGSTSTLSKRDGVEPATKKGG